MRSGRPNRNNSVCTDLYDCHPANLIYQEKFRLGNLSARVNPGSLVGYVLYYVGAADPFPFLAENLLGQKTINFNLYCPFWIKVDKRRSEVAFGPRETSHGYSERGCAAADK